MQVEGSPVRCSGKKRFSPVLLLAVIVFVCSIIDCIPASAQAGAAEEQSTIDGAVKSAIIDSLTAALNEIYVFPDVAKKIEKDLRNKLKKKKYDDIRTIEEFTQRLTEDMEEIAHDGHLWVRPAREGELRRAQRDEPTDEEISERNEWWAYQNFGFERVERMSGNIGYLKLNSFSDAEIAGGTAIAAMNFLANCDAIIVDLTDNGGGSPSMIQLISSYFFEEPTHLNTFYIRRGDEYKQFWTQAHVEGKRLSQMPLYILTSRNTYSGAEEFTYNMKNLERATIIGETTGGGAHPTGVHVFADTKVAASIPFGRAINPVTNTNWEGTGIEPHIQVPRDEALDVAKIEAMNFILENSDDERRKAAIRPIVERLAALKDPADVGEDVLRRWVGDYGPRHITFEEGGLWYERDERPKYRMIPISDTLFCFGEIDYFRLRIETDDEGNPVALIGLYNNGYTDRSPRDGE
jgi:hypothetical protein